MNFQAVKAGKPSLAKAKAVAKATPKAEAKEADAEEKRSSDHLTLPPENRHHWDDSKAAWVQRVRKTVFPLMFREKVTGMENVPKDGAYIVGPTHQSMFDAVAAMRIPGKRAFGSMAAAEQFTGIVGKMMSVSGVFPVDRYKEFEGDFAHPVDHAVEILNEGKPFIFYPEGRIYADEQVYPLKTGIGRIGMNSTAKYTLPVAKTFGEDDETHWGEWAVGLAVSAAAGIGLYAATQASPGIASSIAGLFGGAALGAGVGIMTNPKDDNARALMNTLKWAGIGALGGAGLAGAAGGGLLPAELTGKVTELTGFSGLSSKVLAGTAAGLMGAAGVGATYHWTNRNVARMHIGKPIEIAPYREKAEAALSPESTEQDKKDAIWKAGLELTSDHHKALTEAKFEITGTEQKFKMDKDGNEWGLQPDGNWVRVERDDKTKEWVPISELGQNN